MHEFLGGRLTVRSGDITDERVDAIVNAANWTLLGGGGVDGAIHRRGGPAILEACREVRRTALPDGLPTGEAVITTGGDLPARFVIHTVGPVFGQNGGRDAVLLANAYRNSLELAAAESLTSISFPSISTGAFGYPKHEAAHVAAAAIAEFLDQIAGLQVNLVLFSDSDVSTFLRHSGLKK